MDATICVNSFWVQTRHDCSVFANPINCALEGRVKGCLRGLARNMQTLISIVTRWPAVPLWPFLFAGQRAAYYHDSGVPEEHKGVISFRPINISPNIHSPKLGEMYHNATQNVPGRKGLGRALKLKQQCNEHETCAGKMLEAASWPTMKIIMRWFFYYKSLADFPPYTRPMDHFNAF